jgi:hypothetical protein
VFPILVPIPTKVIDIASGGDSSLVTALIGLIGVAVGGLITGGVQWWLAKQQRDRDDTATRKQAKVAARMINVALSQGRSNIRYCLDHDEWWRTEGMPFEPSTDDLRVLMGELSAEGFYMLERARQSIEHWYSIREYELGKKAQTFSERARYESDSIEIQKAKLREILGWIDAAGLALREVSGDPDSVDEEVLKQYEPKQELPGAEPPPPPPIEPGAATG